MSRLLPYPRLGIALFAMWVLLTGFSPGHIVAAIAVAIFGQHALLRLAPEPPRVRFGRALVKLAGVLLIDIVRSNIAVGRAILFPSGERRSGFVQMPIELRSPYALATLAIILTATPGTLWLRHDARSHHILIHVFDLNNEAAAIAFIKAHYEKLLMEIFE